MQIRLDKYLADMGVGTRSQVKQHIRRKQVTVNGEFSAGPEQKVTPGEDVVSFQGQSIPYAQYEYYLFYNRKAVSAQLLTTATRQSWTIFQRTGGKACFR